MLAVTAFAAPPPITTGNDSSQNYIVLSGGVGELQKKNSDKYPYTSAEYQFKEHYLGLHPFLLGAWGSHAANYFGAGLLYNFDMTRRWRATVSSGPGYYQRGNCSKDLGCHLEFYSKIEISTDVGRGYRLGLRLGHISNAGLRRNNPGTDTLGLVFSVPMP
jgi:lipid A 3-O-deacylase